MSKLKRIQIAKSPKAMVVSRSTFSRRSLHGQTASRLGQMIASGEFPEGSLLPLEADLMDLLECSRSVLREAILVLTAKGMLEARQKLGTRIRPRTEWSLLDPDVVDWVASTGDRDLILQLCEMRTIVEPAMARIAAEQGSRENIAAIGEALRGMEATVDSLESFIPYDLAFHESIIRSTQNMFMGSLSGIIRDAVLTLMVVVQVPEDLRKFRLDLHRETYEAIAKRDGKKAAHSMEKLVSAANEDLLSAMNKED